MLTDIHGSSVSINYIHHKLHSAKLFEVFDEITLNASQTKEYLIITPDIQDVFHTLFSIQNSGSVSMKLFEDCTVSANGSQLTEFNQDRSRKILDGSSGLIVYGAPTVTAPGTQIQSHRSEASYEGGTSSGVYINLNRNSKYRLLITSEVASNKIVVKTMYYPD